MKRIIKIACLFLPCLLCGCAAPASSAGSAGVYTKITAEQAKEMMEDGSEFVLLDVRTEEEYKEKRIDGALLIPDAEITARAGKELGDKAARILVYCRSGRRSALAAQALADMGYTTVFDFGGIIDWTYETVNG